MSRPVDRVLPLLKNVKASGEGYTAQCPAHDDQRASLTVSEGGDGRVLIHCHKGCLTSAVLEKLGLTMRDLFPDNNHSATGNRAAGTRSGHSGRTIEAIYQYHDENDRLLYEVVRFHPKDFRQRRPDGKGGRSWKLGNTPRVLYRLPQITAATPDTTVFIVEGEKDVHTLETHGLLATTNAGGAGKWRHEYSETLRGRPVAIIPDNDEAGHEHAGQVARSLYGKAASIKMVELPGLPPKGDVTDFLTSEQRRQDLQQLVEAVPEWSADSNEVGGNGADGDAETPALANYTDQFGFSGDRPKRVKTALSLHRVMDHLHRRMGDWPCRVGANLFIDVGGKIRWIEDVHSLFAWVQDQGFVHWAGGSDDGGNVFVSRLELFAHLQGAAREFMGTSDQPFFPAREDIYSSWRPPAHYQPDPSPHGYFARLMERFRPASAIDAALLRAMVLTFLWGGPPGGQAAVRPHHQRGGSAAVRQDQGGPAPMGTGRRNLRTPAGATIWRRPWQAVDLNGRDGVPGRPH